MKIDGGPWMGACILFGFWSALMCPTESPFVDLLVGLIGGGWLSLIGAALDTTEEKPDADSDGETGKGGHDDKQEAGV